jgi:hypothetical protein
MRTELLVLSVGIVLLTSGCLGIGGSDGGDGADTGDSPGVDSLEFGPETLTEDEIQESVSFDYLSSFESYTLNVTVTIGNGVRTSLFSSVHEERNTTTDQGVSRLRGILNISTYTEGDVSYQRTVSRPGGELLYERASEPYNDTLINPVRNGSSALRQTDRPSGSLRNLTVTKQGYTTVNGERVAVYNSTSTGNFSPLDINVENTTFNTRSATVYLNRDGKIPTYQLNYTGEDTTTGRVVSIEAQAELYGRNTTTVSTPDWVDEAKNRTESEDP